MNGRISPHFRCSLSTSIIYRSKYRVHNPMTTYIIYKPKCLNFQSNIDWQRYLCANVFTCDEKDENRSVFLVDFCNKFEFNFLCCLTHSIILETTYRLKLPVTTYIIYKRKCLNFQSNIDWRRY